MNCWLVFGALLSTSLLAQQADTNAPVPPPIATPAPAPMATNAPTGPVTSADTNAPAKPKKKKTTKKKTTASKKTAAAELRTVPLVPGPAVVDATHVNIRGKASLKSEVVGRLNKGQSVTVLEEITRNNSGPDEPSAWAKIVLPPDSHVWVNTSFIDPANKTVKPKRLNFRSGPGERFSVLGRLEQGEIVKDVSTKGEWTEIEAPTNGYAFVAAQYLKQEAPGAIAAAPTEPTPAPTEPAPAPTTVTNEATIAAAPTELPATPTPTNAPPAELPAVTNAAPETAAAPAPLPAPDEPPPKRIVDREGYVRGTTSIQAPTKFELVSADNGRTIDYLYTTSPNLDLRRYKGLRIVVTGEEGLEERWGNTPVISIQKIQVVE